MSGVSKASILIWICWRGKFYCVYVRFPFGRNTSVMTFTLCQCSEGEPMKGTTEHSVHTEVPHKYSVLLNPSMLRGLFLEVATEMEGTGKPQPAETQPGSWTTAGAELGVARTADNRHHQLQLVLGLRTTYGLRAAFRQQQAPIQGRAMAS